MNNTITNKRYTQNKLVHFWLYQLAGWMIFFLVQVASFGGEYFFESMALIYAASVSFLSICGSLLLRSLYRHEVFKRLNQAVLTVAIIIVCLLTALIVDITHHSAWYLVGQANTNLMILYTKQPVFAVMFLLWPAYLVWSLLYLVITKQESLKNAIIAKQQLEIELKEHQLNSLLKQLNPHFMFNTINNIRSLILKDHEKARSMLSSFADIMRYQININGDAAVTIQEELDFVHEYIELCKLQLGKRLVFTEKINDVLVNKRIPRMAIQLLIENAIKHGFSQSSAPGELSLVIDFTSDNNIGDDGEWLIRVTNPGKLLLQPSNSGIGLNNLKTRLTMLYNDKCSVVLKALGDKIMCTIAVKTTSESE